MKTFDRIIIGGGLFGLYSTLKSAEMGLHVLLLEKEKDLFLRASYVNQARVHCGMHYLRANDTAKLCTKYYNRFVEDHRGCINSSFKAIYANSGLGSLVSDYEFKNVLESLVIPFRYIDTPSFLNQSSVSVCAEVTETSFDHQLLLLHYLNKIERFGSLVEIHRGEGVRDISISDAFAIINNEYKSSYILNCTYASLNNIIEHIIGVPNKELYNLRYELCEVVLCNVDKQLKDIGLTIMDGPYFSVMPFGKSEYHSLTSVGHTPLYSSEDSFPKFPCQGQACSSRNLELCNLCSNKPPTSFEQMKNILSNYLKKDMVHYSSSLYTIKPILKSSESNDSRPTVIKRHNCTPFIYSVLSGKISSVYELDSIL